MMSTLAQIFKNVKPEPIKYKSFQSEPMKDNVTASLIDQIGIDNASKLYFYLLYIN